MKKNVIYLAVFSISMVIFPILTHGKEFTKTPKKSGEWYLEDFRFGIGAGYGFYINNQMDYTITRNYGDFNELITSYFGSVNKVINEDFEMGIIVKSGHLLTLKSENSQGSSCDFTDGQFVVNYSLNHNVGLTRGNFTINAQAGLGLINFRSMYFIVNTDLKKIDRVYASAGYNGEIISKKDLADKQKAAIGNLGIVMGLRLNKNFMLYWENSLNISSTNKLSGNLFKKSWLPPDSYFFTGLSLNINITPGRGRLACPKF